MAVLAAARGDAGRAERYRAEARRLRDALEQHAWDGAWYRRAFFDDGTPLGSAQSDECRIDSLTQSWAVISGAGDPERARQAMAAVDEHLVDRDAGLIRLFDAAVRPDDPRSRLHQGLRAGRARERRPVHPRRDLGDLGLRAARRRSAGRRAARPDQPDPPRTAPTPTATRSSLTPSPPTSMPCRRTPGAAAGPGTPARPAGSIAWASR